MNRFEFFHIIAVRDENFVYLIDSVDKVTKALLTLEAATQLRNELNKALNETIYTKILEDV